MTRSYKMLVLRAMIESDAFPGQIALTDLVERVARQARRNPQIKNDLSVDSDDTPRLRTVMMQQPCLMTLGAFVRNKSHRPAFKNAGLWWWLDRNMLGL